MDANGIGVQFSRLSSDAARTNGTPSAKPEQARVLSAAEIYAQVAPSVVAMTLTEEGGKVRHKSLDLDNSTATYGSGFIYDSKNRIVVTNWHVASVEKNLTVKIGEKRYQARLLGADPKNDIAVLKVETSDVLPAEAPRGNPAALKVGEKVYTIGSPFGFDRTLGDGIISGPPRTMRGPHGAMVNLVQHNAVTNPGNSGGVLVNERGEIVAMNTMILSSSGGHQGFALSVPIDILVRTVSELLEGRKLVEPELGLVVAETERDGLAVTYIKPGSAADRAGLRTEIKFSTDRSGREAPDFSKTLFLEKINARTVDEGADITAALIRSGSKPVTLDLRLGKKSFSVDLVPDLVELPDVISIQQRLSELKLGPGCEHMRALSAAKPLTEADIKALLHSLTFAFVTGKPETQQLTKLKKLFGRKSEYPMGDLIPVDVYVSRQSALVNLLEAGKGIRWLETNMKKLKFDLIKSDGEHLHFSKKIDAAEMPFALFSVSLLAHGEEPPSFGSGGGAIAIPMEMLQGMMGGEIAGKFSHP